MFFKIDSIAEPKTYEAFLDGLRGIAILMILAFHCSLSITGPSYFPNFADTLEHLSRGVHLFFIVSAFTLFQSSQRRWAEEQRPVFSFYIRRAFRILPLWFLAAFFYWMLWTKASAWDAVLTAFFLFGFFKNSFSLSVIPGGWSLFVEESFYWFFPIWFKIISSFRRSLIALVFSYIVARLWYRYAAYFGSTLENKFDAVFPLGNYYAFFIGIALFFFRKDLLNKINDSKTPDSSVFRWSLDFLALASFVLLFFYDRMVGSLALAPLVIAAFFPTTAIGRLTRSSLVRKYGTCCYSIYLFHSPLHGYLQKWQESYFQMLSLVEASKEIKTLFWFFPTSALSLFLGIVIFRFIERPYVVLGRHFARIASPLMKKVA